MLEKGLTYTCDNHIFPKKNDQFYHSPDQYIADDTAL